MIKSQLTKYQYNYLILFVESKGFGTCNIRSNQHIINEQMAKDTTKEIEKKLKIILEV